METNQANNEKLNCLSDVQLQIVHEIGSAISRLGATSGLMSIIMSWGDTMNDEDTLQCIKDWNKIQPVAQKVERVYAHMPVIDLTGKASSSTGM